VAQNAGSELVQSWLRAHNTSEPAAESLAALSQWQSQSLYYYLCVLILVAAGRHASGELHFSEFKKPFSSEQVAPQDKHPDPCASAGGRGGGGVTQGGAGGGLCRPIAIRPCQSTPYAALSREMPVTYCLFNSMCLICV
jgi:hypothetical protein